MKARIINLEVIQTKEFKTNNSNGIFVPVWRDWDSKLVVSPQMIYYTTLEANTSKGPHLHKLRTGNLTCILGQVTVVLKHGDNYETIILSDKDPKLLEVLPGTGLLMTNNGSEKSIVLNLCSPAWHPDNQDSFLDDFSTYLPLNLKKDAKD